MTFSVFLFAALVRSTPLVLLGLAVALAFRAKLLNIGAEGQFLAGASAAVAVALAFSTWPAAALIPAELAAGALAGAVWAGIAALLKQRFGVLEVISTLMLNFVAQNLVSYLVRGPLQEPTHVYPQTVALSPAARLPMLIPSQRLHAGFLLAICLAIALWWILRYTATGFRVRAVGDGATAAASTGRVAVSRVVFGVFLASGALAGVGGSVEASGVTFALYEGISPGYGYTAIAVALLARLNPLMVVLTGILFGALEAGATALQRDAGVPAVLVNVVEAAIILGVLAAGRATVFAAERAPDIPPRSNRRTCMSGSALTGFLEASIRTATPLAFAALGELVVERSGVINIGLEGAIVSGAFGALVFAGSGGILGGFAGAAAAGLAVGMLFAFFVVTLRADQIITGTAISMLGLGLTGTLYASLYGSAGAALRTPTIASWPVPGLAAIPVLGPVMFSQPPVTYALYLVIPALAWWLHRSPAALALRAVGEHPEAAMGAGISPSRVRWWAILFGGVMGGISGGALVLAQAGTFVEGISAGRGFIAIAIVVLGRWTPLGVALGALLFGAASALQYLSQAIGWNLPYQVPLAFPYVLTLIALASVRGRAAAPAALGEP